MPMKLYSTFKQLFITLHLFEHMHVHQGHQEGTVPHTFYLGLKLFNPASKLYILSKKTPTDASSCASGTVSQ